MKKLVIVVVGLMLFLGTIFVFYKNINNQKKEVFPQLDKTIFIAQVNSVGITRDDYQKKLEKTKNFFTVNKQSTVSAQTLEKNVLDNMINESLISQYAQKQKIAVLDEEINSRYNQIVLGYNKTNKLKQSGDTAFLKKINELYGTDKAAYLQQIKMDILKEKVQGSVGMPLVKWLESEKSRGYIIRN